MRLPDVKIKFIPFILILLAISCNIDHGLTPIHSKMGGKIFFQGTAPGRTDEIRVAVVKEFPPRAINELLFSDQIPFQEDTVEWEIYLPPDEYAAVIVVWKEKYHSWNLSDVIGLYGGQFVGDLLIPTFETVTIPDENAVVDTIHIVANLNRVNRDAGIEGSISFLGDWPSNTGTVAIGAFIDIPEKGNIIDYYFKNVALDFNLPVFVSRYDYRLRVQSAVDTLKYVAVLWIDDQFDLGTIEEIGFYRDPQNPDNPGSVPVARDSTSGGIDITVDFSR